MPETSVIVGASLTVHFFSPRSAVDHVVACLTCRNSAEQSFVCQHGGAPLAHRTRSPWRVLPRARPRRPAPSAYRYRAPTFEVIGAAGTLDGEAFGSLMTLFRRFRRLDFIHPMRKKGRVRSSPVRHREVMMRTLPAMMLHLLNPFVPLFSQGAHGPTSRCCS